MDECSVSDTIDGSNFNELVAEMSNDLYWVRFFARPCCPAPDLEGARAMLDRLAGEVDESNDYNTDQKEQLKELIESRKSWYAKSGLCRASRN